MHAAAGRFGQGGIQVPGAEKKTQSSGGRRARRPMALMAFEMASSVCHQWLFFAFPFAQILALARAGNAP
jgi:hypothetical protein